MASKNEIIEERLSTLASRTGLPEKEIRNIFEQIRDKYPSGGLSLKQLLELFYSSDDEEPLNVEMLEDDYYRRLFYAIDHHHSGKIDIYEYIMIAGLLEADDSQALMKSIFQFCDSNHDDLVTYADVKKALCIFFLKPVDNDIETTEKNESDPFEGETMAVIHKVFDGKPHVSEAEFIHLWIGNSELKEIAKMINDKMVITLSTVTGKFIE
ncbi:unnamed protein product [Adineta ricciae]|uniref:EF-hand domain-containing protein n=1 Tax=Adineta ricciae TaxID=249248 RepID=A0A815YI69_ADIRI|nr:unnamed protein product [Adineta ricciae]CAF1571145.1 unnamed protein product [Adineta ricciae]